MLKSILRKIAVLFLVPLFFMAVYHYAFADSVFTDECLARIQARQAIMETYGLTQSTQAYFEETLTSDDDGYTFVYYAAVDDLDYVLGRYTVHVKDGQAKASWSWDGKEVPFDGYGLAANAWGKDQLMEVWLINKQTSNLQNYGLIARGIAVGAGYAQEGYISPLPEPANADDEFDTYTDYDPAKAKLSVEESRRIAMKALQEAYGLSDDRIAAVRFDEESIWFEGNANGEPLMYITCILWDEGSFREGNGNYYITINQTTGLVESLTYLDGVIGNG